MLIIPKFTTFRKRLNGLSDLPDDLHGALLSWVAPVNKAYQAARSQFRQMTLLRRFMLASFIILIVGMLGVGAWVGNQIEAGVVHRTALTTTLYVDSFIAEHLQNVTAEGTISNAEIATLNSLLKDTPLGRQIAAFKVWEPDGRILYSGNPAIIGQTFPIESGLSAALAGNVSARISDLDDEENVLERELRPHLLEIYSPVRKHGSDKIIAVAEFYQFVDGLDEEISRARWQTWLVVGVATITMYFLLAGFVGRASKMIQRQQNALNYQIGQLMELISQNKELHDRIRRASARGATVQERFLRRVSAEVHDGPVQEVGLALLKLDSVMEQLEEKPQAQPNLADLETVKGSVERALIELRAISGGLGLPELQGLTLTETVKRVIRAHERRTATIVETKLGLLPDSSPLPVKITLYRVIQEALNNAFRHGGGIGQRVRLEFNSNTIQLEVSDGGVGLKSAASAVSDLGEHLGIAGMRERVESLGGVFKIENQPSKGVRVLASLPCQASEGCV